MISVHELIAVFLQRGTCIESIYLRKEKQRHFCQDTYFRSPPKECNIFFIVTLQHHSFTSFDPKGQGRKRPESKNENICDIDQMRKEKIRIVPK